VSCADLYHHGACRQLTSPRIARLLNVFIQEEEIVSGPASASCHYLYVVMELADGPNLWDYVKQAFADEDLQLPEDTARYVAVGWTPVSTSSVVRVLSQKWALRSWPELVEVRHPPMLSLLLLAWAFNRPSTPFRSQHSSWGIHLSSMTSTVITVAAAWGAGQHKLSCQARSVNALLLDLN